MLLASSIQTFGSVFDYLSTSPLLGVVYIGAVCLTFIICMCCFRICCDRN